MSEWEVDNYVEKIRNNQGQYWLFRGLIQQFACFFERPGPPITVHM